MLRLVRQIKMALSCQHCREAAGMKLVVLESISKGIRKENVGVADIGEELTPCRSQCHRACAFIV